ncbi:MAG: DNA polymerase III subunit alpha [Acidobacteria bacterium]|nr:DNA polymerase III subunit alpha [Acidobacteriota bacterium]
MTFVHLHNHTEYSLLDGLTNVKEMVHRAKELGMPAIAITDHGTMFGVAEFYLEARKAGIKPILGCEVYVAQGNRLEKQKGARMNHLVLLARNNTGYRNLCKLVSEGYLSGFYYKPRIDLELLEEYGEGLIGLTACLKGEIPELLLNDRYEDAKKAALRFQKIFGKEHFFLEMQDHDIPAEKEVLPKIMKLARETGIPLVATNDIHYLKREDSEVHDILLCLQTNRLLSDENRMKYMPYKFYLKSREEMEELFSYCPEALDNTLKVAEMCEVELPSKMMLPEFKVPENHTLDSYLEEIARLGLKKLKDDAKLDNTIPMEQYEQRLDTELEVLKIKGFAGYFLITWDFIRFAKERDIPVGPGRGSAAGSLIAYCMGITDVDPLRYKLLFERFLNPERESMPDIDIDFCKNRREEVITYVKEKYGEERVAQIVTFNRMKAKLAIKDVARVMGYPAAEANRVTTKLYPKGLNVPLAQAMEESEELRSFRDENDLNRQLFDYVARIENTARHAGVHAAGVIIAPRPITELAPVFVEPGSKSPVPVVQYDKNLAEGIGLLKMDFLGLKTLSVIDIALDLITARHKITREEIRKAFTDVNDQKVFKLFQNSDTQGIFQFESTGMRGLLKSLHPDKIEDLIACNAMYRPGPIGSGMLDSYIRRRNGQEEVTYPLPELEGILKETHGIILYQEQVMLIAVEVAGYSLGQADLLRKAMGKKKKSVMEEQKKIFLEGAKKRGVDPVKAEELMDTMARFAEYGFNKSHSAAYAILAYQTAWLKAYYPVEFATAVLRMEQASSTKVEDILKFKPMLENMGIALLPPDINRSESSFTIVDKDILFGLGAIKGVGSSAIDVIIDERNKNGMFKDFDDFLSRMDTRKTNKKVMESLIMAGAFDGFGEKRKYLYETLEVTMRFAAKKNEERRMGQRSLFDTLPEPEGDKKASAEEHEEWDKMELLEKEMDVLGFYASGHPLDEVAGELRRFSSLSTADIHQMAAEQEGNEPVPVYKTESVVVGGMIRNLQFRTDRRGRKMASFVLEDLSGRINVVVFASKFPGENQGKGAISNLIELLENGRRVFVSGKLDLSRSTPSMLLDKIMDFNEFVKGGAATLSIDICSGEELNHLRLALEPYRGNDLKLFFKVEIGDKIVWVRSGNNYNLSADILSTSVLSDLGFSYAIR